MCFIAIPDEEQLHKASFSWQDVVWSGGLKLRFQVGVINAAGGIFVEQIDEAVVRGSGSVMFTLFSRRRARDSRAG
jgi:hypothetical protein